MMPTRQACEAQQASQLLGHSGWGIVVAGWSAGGIPLENSSFLCKQELLCLEAQMKYFLSFQLCLPIMHFSADDS